MCGIGGAFSNEERIDLQGITRSILTVQNARGPDFQEAYFHDGGNIRVALCHNRLSVFDPTPQSHQPFHDDTGRYVVTFNGAIYNFVELKVELEARGVKFRTQGDTEVLLEAFKLWGVAALNKFYGMFAFAILDRLSDVLYLARDRFGIKPLCYWEKAGTLLFASTPPAIASCVSAGVNFHFLARGLQSRYFEDSSDETQYLNIRYLLPGHVLRVSVARGGLSTELIKYYDLQSEVLTQSEHLAAIGFQDRILHLRTLLNDACRIRLRSDVPLGVSLSGGIDSGGVARIATMRIPDLAGYSFAHPSEPKSEAAGVQLITNETTINTNWCWFDAPGDEVFDRTMRAQDAPFPTVSIMAQNEVFRRARADGIKVLLGGQGGDEVFMGYRKYYLFWLQQSLRMRRPADILRAVGGLSAILPSILGSASAYRFHLNRYLSGGLRTILRMPASPSSEYSAALQNSSLLSRQILDVTQYSLPTLLRYEDRNSMGNSVESRLPFMDHRIVELGLALPVSDKLAAGYGKRALREALKGILPSSLLQDRSKRGFDVPINHWLRTGLGRAVRSRLNANHRKIKEFLPADLSVDEIFSDKELRDQPNRFAEATHAVWLSEKI